MEDILPINFELIKNPLNWVVILLMLVVAGYALNVLLPDLFPDRLAFVQPNL